MRKFIVYLLLGVLISIVVFPSFAQQNQNALQQEIESLKKQLSEIQTQLKTVENVGKMELAAKLAEAHAKLIETEFDKLKLELKDSNQQWLITWIVVFLAFLSAGGLALWSRLTKKMDDLIADGVEKRLDGFKDTLEDVNLLQDQVWNLLRIHAVNVLGHFGAGYLIELDEHTEQVKALSKEVLLEIFNDKTCDIDYNWLAAEVLIARNYTDCVVPILNFLKDIVNSSDFDKMSIFPHDPGYHIRSMLYPIGQIHTQEIYKCLKSFINHLLTEDRKNKNLWIAWIAHSLASVSVELNKKDSTTILIKSIPDWDFSTDVAIQENEALTEMINYFNLLNAPIGIKAILRNGLTGNLPDVEKQCLELLEKHDPDFVREWKEKKEETNTEGETNGPEPTN